MSRLRKSACAKSTSDRFVRRVGVKDAVAWVAVIALIIARTVANRLLKYVTASKAGSNGSIGR